ncbi:acetyl-CoA synthetase [Methylomarinovum caldicuralii]|uniref:Acetyl-coenzyme A synthetase n=1 Tax=Methylomarinovum caldicuralii TaxID=438856 RepID=A0AAU9CQC5_9GAMM|nr:acetate--CoA ligase [Methylomarinovum caldicuralii]BCX82163.1 acetyl-CoA synthetase [Methylomarinovum caldicuralii]
MPHEKVYPVPPEIAARAHIDAEGYRTLYARSLQEPEAFWAEQAQRFITWERRWERVCDWDFQRAHIRWFEGGRLNACVNCLDRHLDSRGDQTALIWESDNPAVSQRFTYRELHAQVCRLANVLKNQGIGKGDRVCIYLPMIPEAAVAMLACARIGAIHSVVFGGFSAEALRDRILDADCRLLITADEGLRGGKHVPLKANADQALRECPGVRSVLVVRRSGGKIGWTEGRDVWYHEAVAAAAEDCPPESMEAEDPLFILYTSGSTGKPKGVVHTTGGYMVYAAMTHRYVFDYHDGEIYWCTADVGWVTGHTYLVYGPLANGGITLMFEGVPTWPEPDRFWQVVDKHQVNIFYTAPTAIRALMRLGDDYVKRTSRRSLRILGSVGEPINPEAWEWYYHVVGEGRCPIVDTWWQTETGGHMITPLPGATPLKPGSAAWPFFGVEAVILDDKGKEIEGPGEGVLAIKRSWPAQARTLYGNHQRFLETYFKLYPGYYFTGDGARRDEDGYFWITGRVDDVLNVSGHRLGTAEIESALVEHPAVAEAAVVGFPHDVKGQGIYAYVILKEGVQPGEELKRELSEQVSRDIGPIAKPDVIQFARDLPKTRSGKIMRRILRKIAAGQIDDLGDTSTLADPGVVEELIRNRIQAG